MFIRSRSIMSVVSLIILIVLILGLLRAGGRNA